MQGRRIMLIGSIVAGAAGIVLLSHAKRVDDPPAPPAAPTPEEIQQELQRRADIMREQAAPTEMNQVLTRRAGEYTYKSQFRTGRALDEQPIESSGTAKITSILGGRFTMTEEDGSMAGMPFASVKMSGYNRSSGQFEGTWAYNGSTAMMHMYGKSADGGKSIIYEAVSDNDGVKVSFVILSRQVSDDEFTVELKGTAEDGTPGGTLVTTYTRKK